MSKLPLGVSVSIENAHYYLWAASGYYIATFHRGHPYDDQRMAEICAAAINTEVALEEKYQTTDDEYLGDGVYASFDGWHICLDLRAQDSHTRIALEPRVFRRLTEYAHRVRQETTEEG